MRKEVGNLESPVNNEKYFNKQFYVGLFKDFAESLESNDFDTLSSLTEPSFRKRIGSALEATH